MTAHACPICDTVAKIRRGGHAALIAELSESYAVLGENQGCPGWCVLLLKEHAEHLAGLGAARQRSLWDDVARVAGAVRGVFATTGKAGGPPRINYECLGNMVPHIHWHLIPRHADDPEPAKPVWGWPEERLRGAMSPHARTALIERLRIRLGA